MTLRETIDDDALTVFCNTDDFAETVAYFPRGAVVSRSIVAVVFRENIQLITEDGDTVAPRWEVHVHNNATTGIVSTELNLGGDQIELPPRDGQAAVRKSITQLVGQDHGMLVLECR